MPCGFVTLAYHFRAAADEMQECSASIVLKYLQVKSGILLKYFENVNLLQVLKNISNEKNHTVVLPIPNVLMKNQSIRKEQAK